MDFVTPGRAPLTTLKAYATSLMNFILRMFLLTPAQAREGAMQVSHTSPLAATEGHDFDNLNTLLEETLRAFSPNMAPISAQKPRSTVLAPRNMPSTFTPAVNSSPGINSTVPYTYGLDGVALDLDLRLITALWVSMAGIVLLVLGVRLWQLFNSRLRRIYAMSGDKVEQNYWTYEKNSWWPWVKQQIIYAPLGKKRHNREIQLSSAVSYGTLPGRVHLALLASYVVSNIIYCTLLDYKNKDKAALIAEVRGRTGVLATANMIPLVLFAGRNNPLISMIRVSFDTFNLFHRWIGRIVVVEGLAHVFAWGANEVRAYGLYGTLDKLGSNAFFSFGTLAIFSMVFILFQSPSPVRHAFYETFLHLHQLLAFCAVIGVYVHLEVAHLPALPYIRIVIMLWIAERLFRLIRLLRLNISRRNGCTTVTVEALPGEACRVTFHLPRHITVRPGSHVYAYLPTISLWMSHPFSVAWTNIESEPPTGVHSPKFPPPLPSPLSTPSTSPPTSPTLPPRKTPKDPPYTPNTLERQTVLIRPNNHPTKPTVPTNLSLIILARTGMTRHLHTLASSQPNNTTRLTLPGFIEGPYSSHDSLASHGTVILFAAGVGITHHLIQIRHLIGAGVARTVATRRIVLVWSVRTVESLAWVKGWMDEILAMEGRREILKVVVYVTRGLGVRPADTRTEAHAPDGTRRTRAAAGAPAVAVADNANAREQKVLEDIVSSSKTVILKRGRCDPGAVLDEVLPERVGATMVSVCGPGGFADEVRAAVRARLDRGWALEMDEESFTW